MIDIEKLRQDFDVVAENLARRGVPRQQLQALLDADANWRNLSRRAEELQARQNQANDAISRATGKIKAEIITSMKTAKQELASLDIDAAAQAREQLWRQIPNMVMPEVPDGGEENGKVLRYVPEEMKPDKKLPPGYLDWAAPDLVDVVRAAKVSGSRFGYIKSDLARLQIGLVSYLFDKLARKNFVPVLPPVMISEKSMAGMGYLDKHADEIYKTQDDLYLVGTSEQSVGAMHTDEILPPETLPRRYVAYSTCFRREVGSHGKDVKGVLRTHQFDKVEMFSITMPEQSAAEHDFLLSIQEEIMKDLELPYRAVMLAAGDLGMPSAKTYDIETWLPSEGRYRETHSTSNTTDFQSRRLNIRTKNAAGKTVKAHMLNGTALAFSRAHIMILENLRQADGSVAIPKALHSYLPFTRIKKASA